MAGVDAAIEAHPWIDGDRLGVFGGSCEAAAPQPAAISGSVLTSCCLFAGCADGGFMTMWVVTQTNRFKAAISHAGVSNNISFYGTSMYQLLFEFVSSTLLLSGKCACACLTRACTGVCQRDLECARCGVCLAHEPSL